jgi:hypothetical protein
MWVCLAEKAYAKAVGASNSVYVCIFETIHDMCAERVRIYRVNLVSVFGVCMCFCQSCVLLSNYSAKHLHNIGEIDRHWKI